MGNRATIFLKLAILLVVLVANVTFPNRSIGQAADAESAAATRPDETQRLRRRPPGRSSIHGSISGSQPNELADHPLAQLLDQLSEQNHLQLELYGYLQQGVTLNPASPRDRINGPVLNNYRSNAYQMNGLYLVAERKVDTDRNAIQWGGRMDTLYGTDAAFGLSEGFDANLVSDDSSRFYKLALPQVYANIYVPVASGISCKVGKFYSPVGNEWLYNSENFFYSHFLSWNIQPGTHTGALFETKLQDGWELRFGPNFGWNTSENSNNAVSYLGSLQWTSSDEHSNAYFAIQTGKQRTVLTSADSNVTIYSLVLNQDCGDRWHYMLEHDLLISNSRTGVERDSFEAYSLAHYLFYTFCQHWRAGLRLEWLRDDDGTLAGFEPSMPKAPGSYYNLTIGLNWFPREHLRVRPEIRWDWQNRDSGLAVPAFDDGTATNQCLFGCDVLWEF